MENYSTVRNTHTHTHQIIYRSADRIIQGAGYPRWTRARCSAGRAGNLESEISFGWRWGIIARLRSLREEDSTAASTTPGSNYRISPPSPSFPPFLLPCFRFQAKMQPPSPFISLPLDVLLFGVRTYRLGERLSLSLSLSHSGHRPGSEASLTRRLLELSL